METTFLLFEGLYGSGKSTTSQSIANQLSQNHIQAAWLDEYQLLIRFFKDFFVAFQQGKPDLGDLLIASWYHLVKAYTGTSGTFVCDGPFFTNNIMRMLSANIPEAVIVSYAEQTLRLLAPLNPKIIYLTSDLNTTLVDTCRVRGANWTQFTVDQTEHFAYQRARNRVGWNGLLHFFLDAQNLFSRITTVLEVDCLQIDTTAQQWQAYQSHIMTHLGIAEVPVDVLQVPDVVQHQYSGVYVGDGEFAHQGPFRVEQIDGQLKFRTSYSDDYTLVPVTEQRFAIRGTPLAVDFVRDEHGRVKALRHTFWDGQVYVCRKLESKQI